MKLMAAAALASFVITSGAGAKADDATVRSQFHHSYPLSANGALSIKDPFGDIHVIGWNENSVRVDAMLCAPSADALRAIKISVSNTPDVISVQTMYPSNSISGWSWMRFWKKTSWCSERGEVDYTVHVPTRARIDLSSTSGDITAADVSGPVAVGSTSGDITARNVTDFSASAVSGDVSVTHAQGTCDISETSGSILFQGVSGSVKATSVSGDVDLYEVAGKAVVSTTSGDITARVFRGLARLNSTSGDISMTLVRGSGVALNASTLHGSLESSVPMEVGAPVEARTLTGDISARFI